MSVAMNAIFLPCSFWSAIRPPSSSFPGGFQPGHAPNAPGRIRTCDPRLRRPPLCPLSYRRSSRMVERAGRAISRRACRGARRVARRPELLDDEKPSCRSTTVSSVGSSWPGATMKRADCCARRRSPRAERTGGRRTSRPRTRRRTRSRSPPKRGRRRGSPRLPLGRALRCERPALPRTSHEVYTQPGLRADRLRQRSLSDVGDRGQQHRQPDSGTRTSAVRASNDRIASRAEALRFTSRVPLLCECEDPGCRAIVARLTRRLPPHCGGRRRSSVIGTSAAVSMSA